VNARIESDVLAASGLSAPDFEVLFRLSELGNGALHQHEIRRALGWEKSRLSRHLTRMEERGLLLRKGARTGGVGAVEVSITPEGRKALRAAKPLHGDAVRRHFLEKLARADRTLLVRLLAELESDDA
jgi:DNA-binding MarR family transcriptional regulator